MKRYYRSFTAKSYAELNEKCYHFNQFCTHNKYKLELLECTMDLSSDDLDLTQKVRVTTDDTPERMTTAANLIEAAVEKAFRS